MARELLPNLPDENFVAEPAARGTSAAIGLATLKVAKLYPKSICTVLASDHYIPDGDYLRDTIYQAAIAASSGPNLVSIGIVPTFPHDGYGYMKCGKQWRDGSEIKIGTMYHEKPDIETARKYISENQWLWNANIFVWSIRTIISAFRYFSLTNFELLESALRAMDNNDSKLAYDEFTKIKDISIDYEILERIRTRDPFKQLYLAYRGRWSDAGTFTLLKALLRGQDGNSVAGHVTGKDMRNCVVISEHPYRIIADGIKDSDVIVNYRGDIFVKPTSRVIANGVDPINSSKHDKPSSNVIPATKRLHSLLDRMKNDSSEATAASAKAVKGKGGVFDYDIAIRPTRHRSGKSDINICIMSDEKIAAESAADLLVENLRSCLSKRQKVVLVPSSGRSMNNIFKHIMEHDRFSINWSRVIVFQMDEYCGVSCDDPGSLAFKLREEFISPLRIEDFRSINDRQGLQRLPSQLYDAELDGIGGIDVILHGIGRNGHLGFNEPGASFFGRSCRQVLTPETLQANFGDGALPKGFTGEGVTLGHLTMAEARCAILVAFGAEKYRAVKRALEEAPNEALPASRLQLHPNVTFVVDRAAYVGDAWRPGTPISVAV